MNTPEAKILQSLPPIEKQLYDALTAAAGESVGYILIIVPSGRIGDHIMTSNISETSVIYTFLSDAIDVIKNSWEKSIAYAEQLRNKVLN